MEASFDLLSKSNIEDIEMYIASILYIAFIQFIFPPFF